MIHGVSFHLSFSRGNRSLPGSRLSSSSFSSISSLAQVNLGGWLVLEPFISPGIFEDWRTTPGGADIVDEYTLTAAMKAAGNLTAAMTERECRTLVV